FLPGLYPGAHTCTASVLRSRHGDVIVTAAHCMTGSGLGYEFAPGYDKGKTPYGVWRVTAAYGSARWIRSQDPQRDWAFLTVAPKRRGGKTVTVAQVTGGNRLGAVARSGRKVTVPGYPVGTADAPITCRATVYHHRGYPAFDCGG